ncbi:hypothetical protein [Methylobacter sp. S3L5C]|uniref:hypothetical protein n=1 Tax=Methylobacter sp. S3L5C TaxID=2839024 RepID=UPI001FAC721A|nr:hypothetical protein [Methylobacter sp. S3L5C]UOA07217.1 hypothetical protein KKZ03_13000 [Methylobacter sp. S3L5C]
MSNEQMPDFNLSEPFLLHNDKDSQLCNILTAFNEEYPSIIDELSANISKGYLYEVKLQLHKIKIFADDIGAIRLSHLSKQFELQLENRHIETETWDQWKIVLSDTIQAITEFLSTHCFDSPHKDGVLQADIILLLQELDAQLLENTYIDTALLNKIHAVIDRNKLQEYQRLLDSLMHYDYPKARSILANVLRNPHNLT